MIFLTLDLFQGKRYSPLIIISNIADRFRRKLFKMQKNSFMKYLKLFQNRRTLINTGL
jgi:hypothetical protein